MEKALDGFRKRKTALFIASALTPALVYLVFFFYYPFIMNMFWMFYDYSFIQKASFSGLANVREFFHDPLVGSAFKNTFLLTALSTPIVVACSLFVALGVYRLAFGKTLFRSMIFMTFLMPMIAAAIVFHLLFSTDGLVNALLASLGLKSVPWLTDTHWALATIVIFSVWKYIGYFMVILLAGISNINVELYEAAMVDGASVPKRFWHVTLPQLKPPLVYCIIIATINYLSAYPQVVAITGGGPYRSTQTILMYMFDQAFNSMKVGYASVIAMALFLIILLVTVVQMKFAKINDM